MRHIKINEGLLVLGKGRRSDVLYDFESSIELRPKTGPSTRQLPLERRHQDTIALFFTGTARGTYC